MSSGRPGADLRSAFEAAWQRSDQIFGLLHADALLMRPIELRQPFLFYVGHLPAFAWNHLGRGVLGQAAFEPELDRLFEAGIDPPDDVDPVIADAPEAWPALERVLAYRDRVRERLREELDEPALHGVLPMVLEHELMHHETLLYMFERLPSPVRAAYPASEPAPRVETQAPSGRVRIPAGPARLGAPRDGRFRWDNEHPEQIVHVEAFEIDALPVTNREFREFEAAGGYADRRLWSDDGWSWTRRREPMQTRVPAGAREDWPAQVALCEAAAFARWRGARLPSEAEFHRAAYATPSGALREHPWGDEAPDARHGNLGFRHWGPTPAGAFPDGASAFGVHELVGNGWEWTGTRFGPFPGFQRLERYPGYSANFFDDRHFVLLGASWATDTRLVRRSFRNWFQPHYPHVFAKFRCAA